MPLLEKFCPESIHIYIYILEVQGRASRGLHIFLGHFWIFIALLGVRRGLKMILSHRAPSSLNMSSYRTIWTKFKPNFIFVEQKYQILVPKSRFWIGGSMNCFYWRADAFHAPCCMASSSPKPLAGGLQHAPLHTERLRLSGFRRPCKTLVPSP